MKVSLNWVKFINDKYGSSASPDSGGIDKLVDKIGAQLGGVEEVINLGKKYEGIFVAKVVTCRKHSNADKLKVCLVDDGGVTKTVKRDTKGLIEVVCGAPNVAEGQLVVWLPPGAVVPATSDKDPLILEAREIRGVISNGMIASLKELDIGDDHSGILVLEDSKLKPGTPLAKALGLDDYVIDIENKMFTHRPDLFGQLGIARELAGIQGHVFKSPSWYRENPPIPKPAGPPTHKIAVKNTLPELVPRFVAVVLKDIKVGPSPLWLKLRLNSVGVKSINNIVDVTNYLMYETAQPLHAYDYDKLSGTIGTRLAKDGEGLTILGGKTIKLNKNDIVVTSGDRLIGLGGVMGGAETEVSESTKNIVLEVANFDMNTVRKTAMEHGLFSEAATRFTKNQSPRQNLAVTVKAIELMKQLAGGRQASEVIDDKHFKSNDQVVKLTTQFINERLGLTLSATEIKKLLENVEFDVSISGQKLATTAPFWRTDIEIPEDIVEEVGRLYGYDHLPLQLPTRDLKPAKLNEKLVFKNKIRQALSAAGANEILTYSFVDGRLIQNAGQDIKEAFHIRNALSPDLQYYRLSLIPSLLEKVHPNIKEGFDKFVLFELGRAHIKGVLDTEKLPKELQRLGIVLAKSQADNQQGAPYYSAKTKLEYLLHSLGIHPVKYEPIGPKLEKSWQVAALSFEPSRSAAVYYQKELIGLLGEPIGQLKTSLKLPIYTAQAELDINLLFRHAGALKYNPLNRYPSLSQDITLKVSINHSFAQLSDLISDFLQKAENTNGYIYELVPLDIYQKADDHRQISFRINLSHAERTLTTVETNKLLDKLSQMAKTKLDALRV